MLTGHLAQRDAVRWVNNVHGAKDINTARQRLGRLLQEEGLLVTVGAQTPGAVDSKLTHPVCNSPPIEYPSISRQKCIH